jgi:ArsR family transcriptional regulator
MDSKEQLRYQAKANVLKALAHPSRLWIAEKLSDGEKCVCELVEGIGADFSTVSKHLTILKNAGLVSVEKRGKQQFYSLKVPCVLKFMNCVEAVLARQAEEHLSLID